MSRPGWTPERVERLAALVAERRTATQIGVALGISRNAVIGKILRLKGAAGHLKPRTGAVPDRKKARAARRRVAGVAAQPVITEAGWQPPARTMPALVPMRFADASMTGRCLHFVGDWLGPSGPDMPVCGGERSERAWPVPYCPMHARSSRIMRGVAA